MQSVGQKHTGSEMTVRRFAHAMGFRYSLHRRDLPGKPDLAFPARQKAIFVNGCFWHGHGCPKGRPPKSRSEYWQPKIASNVERDARATEQLTADGWQVLTIWQCEIRDAPTLMARLRKFLESP